MKILRVWSQAELAWSDDKADGVPEKDWLRDGATDAMATVARLARETAEHVWVDYAVCKKNEKFVTYTVAYAAAKQIESQYELGELVLKSKMRPKRVGQGG